MDLRQNVTPIKVINKGAFGGTHFREIFILVLPINGIRTHRKNFIC